MKKFLVTLLFFSVPVLLLLVPPTYILFATKESFYDVTNALQHSETKHLIGYRYEESNYKYIKWWNFCYRTPDPKVLCLGSSRVLQFREEMFNVPFYNAGLAAMTLTDFQPFLQSTAKKVYPDYLIINIDQWMFNAAWDNLQTKSDPDQWRNSFTKRPNPAVYKNLWNDLWQENQTNSKAFHSLAPKPIGLQARDYGIGLRNDGSMCYGNQIEKLLSDDSSANDYHYQKTFQWIDQGIKRFEYGDSLNPQAFIVLEKLLLFCRQHSIHVVAFLPPYAKEVYQRMKESGKYNYLDKVYPALEPLFKKYHYEWYDYTRLEQLSSGDDETIDGFHASEVTYLKLLINMLENGSQLNHATDIQELKSDLKNKINRYTVYTY